MFHTSIKSIAAFWILEYYTRRGGRERFDVPMTHCFVLEYGHRADPVED